MADVDDPQPPTVGTDKHIWKAKLKLPLPQTLPVLQFSASPGLPLPHAHMEVEVWSNSCSRKTNHSLNITRCREGVKTPFEMVPLISHPKGQKLPRQPLSHHATHCLLLWDLTISPVCVQLPRLVPWFKARQDSLPASKLIILPYPRLETLHY